MAGASRRLFPGGGALQILIIQVRRAQRLSGFWVMRGRAILKLTGKIFAGAARKMILDSAVLFSTMHGLQKQQVGLKHFSLARRCAA